MATDVSDDTFVTAVMDRSDEVPVVVDLWAPWCGPCRSLGPIIEASVAETNGRVELVKVNVDKNPRISATFSVQSIPAVYALHKRKVVDHFVGALGRAAVDEFVARLVPVATKTDELLAIGDEPALREVLESEPANTTAVTALATLLIDSDRSDEALRLLQRIPEDASVRAIAARARTGLTDVSTEASAIEDELQFLLTQVKDDDVARQRFVDLLEVMGPENPKTAEFRKALTARLY